MKKLLLLAVALVATTCIYAQEFGRVYGTVTDKASKKAVQTAMVTIKGDAIKEPVVKRNSEQGFLAMLPLGYYTITIEAEGYTPETITIEVTEEDSPIGKIKIEKSDDQK